MDIEIPDWLNEEFLKKLLEDNQDGLNKYDVRIMNHEFYRRVPKGTNYLSNLIGINIQFKKIHENGSLDDQISLVAKIPRLEDELSIFNKCGILEREVEAYYELLPKLNEIITENGEDRLISPRCYRCDVDRVVILEDLKTTGYVMLDKRKQMGYDLAETTMAYLAKFHAASIKVHENEPELVERIGRHLIYTRPMDPEVKKMMDPCLGEERMEMLCAEFERYPESKKFVNILSKLKLKFWDYMLDANERCDDEFLALNHTDAYLNNILFLFDTDKSVQNIAFVDYQTLKYTSPTVDVLFFLGLSVKYDVIAERFTELTESYLNSLNTYLKKYGSEFRLSEESFRKSLEKRETYFLVNCIHMLPFAFAGYEDFPEDEEPPEIPQPEYPFFEYSQTAKFRNTIVNYLELFSTRPWFQRLNNETEI